MRGAARYDWTFQSAVRAQLQKVTNTKLQVAWWLREELVCPLALRSAYAPNQANISPWTTMTPTRFGCVGYVLFRPARLALSGRMPLPKSA